MQHTFAFPISIPQSAYDYGKRSSGSTHGVVLTKPHIVDLILDLVGYVPTQNLTKLRLLEPSCGEGVFVVQAVRRLLTSLKNQSCRPQSLEHCIMAIDIDLKHVDETRDLVHAELTNAGISKRNADRLVRRWIVHSDFLLSEHASLFDFIVGNPPYIRIEQLSPVLLSEYRRRCSSIYDRADLYVAFIERSLQLLTRGGALSFICANRWTSNKYGAPLRKIITEKYQVAAYVDLHSAQPFETDVSAYPSIFVVRNGKTNKVPVFSMPTASPEECKAVARSFLSIKSPPKRTKIIRSDYTKWFRGTEPWVLNSPKHLAMLRHLEGRFAPIQAHAKIGIGVATGNDKVYIVGNDVEIEEDRIVSLVMRNDIKKGRIQKSNRYVINTFDSNGRVIKLSNYPKLARYFESCQKEIRKRHVAQKNPTAWFRTIDRVYPELAKCPKLLIPDIAGSNEVVLEHGYYHPHHNLYYVVSDEWDLEILGALLSSRVALFFVWSYAVKMRGGYLRFQAQYLRRICLPSPHEIKKPLARDLKKAFQLREFSKIDDLSLRAYSISQLPDFEFIDTRV